MTIKHSQLFPYIKKIVDKNQTQKCLFWLTGSQQFSMMKNISESLAGRVVILNMLGVSLAEEEGRKNTKPFIPKKTTLRERKETCSEISVEDIYHKIWRGSYPALVTHSSMDWQQFYNSYILTYVERDVREYLQIGDLILFKKFMQVVAARTARMVNYREISKEVGVSEPTIKSWFGSLKVTGLVTLIYPYYKNVGKRILKTPKLYFLDTGLCSFLTKWSSPDVLEKGAMAGAILETYVASEIMKSYLNYGMEAPIYYYIDKERRKVDLLIEEGGVIYPIEIKKTSSVRNSGFKGFAFLKNLKTPIGDGCILCFGDEYMPFNVEIGIVPIGYV